jgi:hydrogenase-4 component F
MTLYFLLLPPLAASCVAILVRRYRPVVGWVSIGASLVSFSAAIALCTTAISATGTQGTFTGRGLWQIDAISSLLALCIACVALLASVFGPGLTSAEPEEGGACRRFRVFANAFAFTMLAAVTVQNVALMWVAIEATTITSAMLIPWHRSKASVEASWKYLLICSVGIALAFAGTVLAYTDSVATMGDVPGALNWSALRAASPNLHPVLLQLAFAFIVVGYGTKAGLAPMHTWLPDAHSEAPSPISAMMSGVLLAVAMYAIARWKSVVDAAVGPSFSTALMLSVGVASVALGVFSLVIQRHYKRMLAYSSVEHMGLVCLGLALGPVGVFAACLHIVNHAVAKSVAFLLSGRILQRYRTTEIAKVTGLFRVMPWTGGLFAAGLLALVGLPPFGLFVSEFLLVRAAIAGGRLWLAFLLLGLLLTAFVSILSHLNLMLYGDPPEGIAIGERTPILLALLAVPVGALVVLGVILPPALTALINQSVANLTP